MNDIYGAAHAFDLPFIFGTFGPSLFSNVANSTANRPGRLALSQAMMESLGAFARSGDPNAPAALGVTWPIWPSTLIFDATPTDKAISVHRGPIERFRFRPSGPVRALRMDLELNASAPSSPAAAAASAR